MSFRTFNLGFAAVLALGFAAPSIAQTPIPASSGGRSFNVRSVSNPNNNWTGATTTFNNGTSNLSVPVATGTPGTASTTQASFNMWVYMQTSASAPGCYAEVDVLKRNSVLPPTATFTGTYSGRIFTYTTVNPQGKPIQPQFAPTPIVNNTAQGGMVGEITIGSNGNLKFSGGGVTLTTPNFQCKASNGVYVYPTGFSIVDRGFEGNTTASTWTNGSSMGKTQERIGSGSYQTSPNQVIPPVAFTYPSWTSSYSANDNQGTIILFR
jgi:hypothetical protein